MDVRETGVSPQRGRQISPAGHSPRASHHQGGHVGKDCRLNLISQLTAVSCNLELNHRFLAVSTNHHTIQVCQITAIMTERTS